MARRLSLWCLTLGLALAQVGASQHDAGQRSLEELIAATRDPVWKTRWDAVNQLGVRKDRRAVPALVERALRDENPHPRWRSLWALVAVDLVGTDALPLLAVGLEDGDPVVRRNAAVALAFYGDDAALPELLRGLKDPDEARRWEALYSLRRLARPGLVEPVSRRLERTAEASVRVRGEAALVLGKIGNEAAVTLLLAALRHDPARDVRWRAALALSPLDDDRLGVALAASRALEPDPSVRELLDRTLSRLGGPSY